MRARRVEIQPEPLVRAVEALPVPPGTMKEEESPLVPWRARPKLFRRAAWASVSAGEARLRAMALPSPQVSATESLPWASVWPAAARALRPAEFETGWPAGASFDTGKIRHKSAPTEIQPARPESKACGAGAAAREVARAGEGAEAQRPAEAARPVEKRSPAWSWWAIPGALRISRRKANPSRSGCRTDRR